MPTILLTADEPGIREKLAESLRLARLEVLTAADHHAALNALDHTGVDVAVFDMFARHPGAGEAFHTMLRLYPALPLILMIDERDLASLPATVRVASYSFLPKPVVLHVLVRTVERAAEHRRLVEDNCRLADALARQSTALEARLAEVQMIQARLAHAEKIAALGQMAAQVAHEVRNPLAGLRLYALHFRDQVAAKLNADEMMLVNKITHEVERLTATTDHILNFVRPLVINPRRVNLVCIVEDALGLLRPHLRDDTVMIDLRFASSEVEVSADSSALQGAVLNLLLNAVQAMSESVTMIRDAGGETSHEAGKEKRLTVAAHETQDAVYLSVADTGCGMSAEQLERVCEPFYTTKHRGLGLGLAYAKKIVEEHHGTLHIESWLNEGTQIRIKLPKDR